MGSSRRFIPFSHLPPGFSRSLDDPPRAPSHPRLSSTLVLVRRAPEGVETLLLERNPRAGFIPGAWVFPGGRVDPDDDDPAFLPRLAGLDPLALSRRLGLDGAGLGNHPHVTGTAFLVAALRETFEETGVLLVAGAERGPNRDPLQEQVRRRARARLLRGESTFSAILQELDLEMDAGALEYVGHWVTPEVEPRRYDTRFFAAILPPDAQVSLAGGEMVDALWLTPGEALARNRAGALPLVFPTLRTLEVMERYREPEGFLHHFRDRTIPRLLPTLRKRPDGIEILLEEPETA